MNHQAIRNVYPEVVTIDDNLGAFDAQGNKINIDANLIAAKTNKLQTDFAAKQYQRDRAKEYPSFADQFDMLYHGGYDAWKSFIQLIKDKHPKNISEK